MKYFHLIWYSLWHKSGRTVLTLLSAASAFLLLGVMQTVGYAMSHPSPAFGADTLLVLNKASYGLPLPYAYRQDLESIPGVGLLTEDDGLLGYFQSPDNTVFAEAIDPATYFAIQHDQLSISDAELNSLKNTRTGAIVGPRIAAKYGWKVGDRIMLHANGKFMRRDGSVDWPFDIVGIAKVNHPQDMHQFGDRLIFQYTYLDEARLLNKGKVSMFIAKPTASADAAQAARAIDARFANSSYETRTLPMKELTLVIVKQFGNIGFIIRSITAAVLITLAFMTGNAMIHTFYERIPEFAVLKTIGFSNRLVAQLIVAESAMTVMIGAAAGICGAYLLIPLLKKGITGVILSPIALMPGAVMAAVLAIGIGLIPAWRAQRLQIVDALAGGH